jgi:hypothetical protein
VLLGAELIHCYQHLLPLSGIILSLGCGLCGYSHLLIGPSMGLRHVSYEITGGGNLQDLARYRDQLDSRAWS